MFGRTTDRVKKMMMILCSLLLLPAAAAFTPRLGARASNVALKLNFDRDDTLASSPMSRPDRYDMEASRRSFLNRSSSVTAGVAALLLQNSSPAAAAEEDELISVYFGCGCFWHVQHEFVEAERNILQRSDDAITSRAGYAGGKAGSLVGAGVDFELLSNSLTFRISKPATSRTERYATTMRRM